VFEYAFSSRDDDIVADAVSVWVVGGDPAPGLFARYFAKRMERKGPVSPRLRQVTIRAIELIKDNVLEVLGFESIRLLNCLDVDLDDVVDKHVWVELLAGVICLPAGLESLSPHYWHLLDKLPLANDFRRTPGLRSVEVMRSLDEADDWEKLEVWMVVVWQSLLESTPTPMMEDVERVTLELLRRHSSAPPRFETLREGGDLYGSQRTKLQRICDQARAEQLSSESPPSPYVSVRPAPPLPVLILPYSSLQSIDSRPTTCSPSFCGRRYFLNLPIVYVMSWCTESCGVCA
jgi:hypothetical protein